MVEDQQRDDVAVRREIGPRVESIGERRQVQIRFVDLDIAQRLGRRSARCQGAGLLAP
jgi:hypothetical protein